MVKDERGKSFSCLKCGDTFTAYPPDDFHHVASLKPTGIEDPIKIDYKCQNCANTNTLYWGWQKMAFAFG